MTPSSAKTSPVPSTISQKTYFQALGGGDLGAKATMIGYLLSISSDVHLGVCQQAAHDQIASDVRLVGGLSAIG
jgi:hypothetical protein